MVLEVTVTKLRQAALGVSFKQDQNVIIIDAVQPHSPGARCGLKSGDILLAIESKNINSIQQISKLTKSLSNSSISFRVERVVDNYVFRKKINEKKESAKVQNVANADNVEEAELTQIEQDSFVIVESVKPKVVNEGTEARKTRSMSGFDKFKTPEKVNVIIIIQSLVGGINRKRKYEEYSHRLVLFWLLWTNLLFFLCVQVFIPLNHVALMNANKPEARVHDPITNTFFCSLCPQLSFSIL